jgi:hypothetical protein
MMSVICHHKGKYNVYSTVSDGFYFESGLTLEQLQQWVKDEYGLKGLASLPARLKRAHEKGHSSIIDGGEDLNGFLSCNRAGVGEKHLSTAECIKQFLS